MYTYVYNISIRMYIGYIHVPRIHVLANIYAYKHVHIITTERVVCGMQHTGTHLQHVVTNFQGVGSI